MAYCKNLFEEEFSSDQFREAKEAEEKDGIEGYRFYFALLGRKEKARKKRRLAKTLCKKRNREDGVTRRETR